MGGWVGGWVGWGADRGGLGLRARSCGARAGGGKGGGRWPVRVVGGGSGCGRAAQRPLPYTPTLGPCPPPHQKKEQKRNPSRSPSVRTLDHAVLWVDQHDASVWVLHAQQRVIGLGGQVLRHQRRAVREEGGVDAVGPDLQRDVYGWVFGGARAVVVGGEGCAGCVVAGASAFSS